MVSKIYKKVSILERLKKDPGRDSIIKVRNLDVFFGRGSYLNHAVKNVSFNILRGEVFGLVGESGSGKTTIGRCIVGLVDYRNGSINVDNSPIPKKSWRVRGKVRRNLIKKVQMIFQDPASSLNPYKTINKVVKEGLDNLDARAIFENQFDGETISTLYKIIPTKELPEVLKKNNLAFFTSLIEKDSKKFNKIIFEEVYEKIKNNYYVKTYLELRKHLRQDLLSNRKSKEVIKEQLIDAIIKAVGISKSMLNRYALEFSGGQQQRIGIARSVVMKPKIIVADEPISALDVSIQAQVINIFNDLKDKLNLTFLFIAHDLRMVEYISDRIAVINNGTIVEIGPAHEVINNPIHPYTKTLIGSIPTINTINESLRSIPYDEAMHQYNERNQPEWYKVISNTKEHYVYASEKEAEKWIQGVANG